MNGRRACKQLLVDEWNERASTELQLSEKKVPTVLRALGLKPGVMTSKQVGIHTSAFEASSAPDMISANSQ
jgi:hypothetical protein